MKKYLITLSIVLFAIALIATIWFFASAAVQNVTITEHWQNLMQALKLVKKSAEPAVETTAAVIGI